MSIACPRLLLGSERILTRVISVAGERSNHFATEQQKNYKHDKYTTKTTLKLHW